MEAGLGDDDRHDGALWQDRTTLTPLDEGRVRQHIEISPDGTGWQTTFDAVYVPR